MRPSLPRARERIDKRLGERLTDELWEEHGQELHQDLDAYGIEFAVEAAWDLLHPERVQQVVLPPDAERESPDALQLRATDLRRKHNARQAPRVKALSFVSYAVIMQGPTGQMIDDWRAEHLDGELLGADEVEEWWHRWLGGGVKHISPLVRRLTHHGMSAGDAFGVVLAGLPPIVPPIRIEPGRGVIPTFQVTLTPGLTVREVTGLLKEWWPVMFPTASSNALTDKQAELLSFIAQHSQPGQWEGWAEVHRQWNKRHRRWNCRSVSDFKRDACREWRQVTGRAWQEPPMREE